jgi:hypothetical protein
MGATELRVKAFSIPPTQFTLARTTTTTTTTRVNSNDITPSSEWDARNVYDDLEGLRLSISQEEAEDKLRENQRLELLNAFATNRRPLFPDVKRYVLLPIASALLLAALSVQSRAFAQARYSLGLVFRFEFWFVVVAAPIRLLLTTYRTAPPPVKKEEEESPYVRGSELYATIIQLEDKQETNSRDTVLSLLEQWASAVAGTALLGSWFAVTNTGRGFARLWPCLRFITRLGAIASLHQYPKFLYDIRRLPRPVNKLESRLQRISKTMLHLAVFGLTMDLSEMMIRTLPRVVLLTMSIVLLGICDLQSILSKSAATTLQGNIQHLSMKAIGWAPYILSGRLLWSIPATQMKSFFLSGLLPIGVSTVAPFLHLVAVLRLVRIQYTHDLSLANASMRHILQDPEALQKRTKWRHRLNWREHTLRLREAISLFIEDEVYRIFFQGGVQDKILETSRKNIQQDTKNLEEKVLEIDRLDTSIDSTKWKDESTRNLASEHQRDYDNGNFRDPLGVAIQQTFGIGLGYADSHMDALSEGEEPSPRRLQSRAAKSAIRRVQEIYDQTLDIDWDSITDFDEKESLKADLRQREKAETEYLAKQLTDLVPSQDDGDDDDPASRINLPKTSIRKMIRTLTSGPLEYDASDDPIVDPPAIDTPNENA